MLSMNYLIIVWASIYYLVQSKGGGGTGSSSSSGTKSSSSTSSGTKSPGTLSGSTSSGTKSSTTTGSTTKSSYLTGGTSTTSGVRYSSYSSYGYYNGVWGYPSRYGYSSLYLNHLLYYRRTYYYRNRPSTNCVTFNTASYSNTTWGPAMFSGVYSFYGNGTISTNVSEPWRLKFSSYNDTLNSTVLSTAIKLNATLAANFTLGLILQDMNDFVKMLLRSDDSRVTLSSADISGSANLTGNMYSVDDSVIFSGNFSISQFKGTIDSPDDGVTFNFTDSTLLNLNLTKTTSIVITNDTVEIVTSFNGPIRISNFNVTTSGVSNFSELSQTMKVDLVSIDECAASSSSSAGMIAGIVIAAIVFCVLCYFAFKWWKQRSSRTHPAPPLNPNDGKSNNTMMAPPYHNLNNATAESLVKSQRFLQEFPPGSQIAAEAAAFTAYIPLTAQYSLTALTMMEPRQFTAYPFDNPVPQVTIATMNVYTGEQIISFNTTQDVSIQSNIALRPRCMFAAGSHGQVLPPPSYAQYANQVSVEECYYEIEILKFDDPTRNTIAVGFATCPYPMFRLPGWNLNSVGYHSDDGAKFLNDVDYGQPYAQPFKQGDTIGVGYTVRYIGNTWSFDFFFSHNGVRLPNAFTDVRDMFSPMHMYPTIGASSDCIFKIRFGNLS